MINSIRLYILRNSEYSQFIVNVLSIVEHNGAAALNVQQQYDQLHSLSEQLEALFKIPTGSMISTELQELDLRRDKLISGIANVIDGHTNNPDAAISAHAKLLDDHLSLFGAVARANYPTETISIRKIIADWDNTPQLATAILALGLTAWKNDLKNANDQFDHRYIARAEETGAAPTISFREKRLEVNEAYYDLRDLLNAYYKINKGADPFENTISSLNAMIEKYNVLLERRVRKNIKEPGAAV